MLKFLANIIQLIFSPLKGWEDIEDADSRADSRGYINIRSLYLGCFLPLILICSLSAMLRMIYGDGFLAVLQVAIIEFFSLFLSYHLAVYIFSWLMPSIMKEDKGLIDQRREAMMVMYCISVIALIFLLGNVIKVKLALIQFLPLYVVFIIWKGARFVGVPDRAVGHFMIMASIAILGAVYGLSSLFSMLI